MKKILVVCCGLLIATLSATSIGWHGASRLSRNRLETIEELKASVEFQRRTIDSLLNLPPAEINELTVELHLDVTDRSRLTVNGKGNSGTIAVPTERKYTVEIDSAIFNVIRKE